MAAARRQMPDPARHPAAHPLELLQVGHDILDDLARPVAVHQQRAPRVLHLQHQKGEVELAGRQAAAAAGGSGARSLPESLHA